MHSSVAFSSSFFRYPLFIISISFIICPIIVVDSARILATVFTPSYSHQLAFRPIWRELSLRGHQVTLLTTDPAKESKLTNLTEIDLSYSYEIVKSHNATTMLSSTEHGFVERVGAYMRALHSVADWQLSHPQVQRMIKNESEKFDLLITEVIYPTHMAFAARFGVPFIGLVSLDAPSRLHSTMGNPIHPVLYPDYQLPFVKDLTFKERLISFLYLGVYLLYGTWRLYPREEATVRKHFGEDMPSLYDIQRNMSMMFLNINPALHSLRPMVLATQYIGGGLHFDDETQPKLSQDLRKHLDRAKNGFVYFSLGTNIISSSLSPQLKRTILQALSELPYEVLWKFEDDHMPDKPKNVKILKWVPQMAVLGHPNIKLFITQCGLQSMEEAIYHHVPMIGLPFYGDQGHNAKLLEVKGLGLSLDPTSLDPNEFRDAILKVAASPEYKDNVREIADLYKDEAMSGLDKAVWWTEYVIRHKGAKHLRSPGADLPLYQYFLLDVIGFLMVVMSVNVYLCGKLIRCALRKCFGRATEVVKRKSD